MTRKRQWGTLIGATFLAASASTVASVCLAATYVLALDRQFWPMAAFEVLFCVAMWLTARYNSLIMRLAS